MRRTVASEFWTDSKIENLSSTTKYVLLYLLTSPIGTMSGCYEVSYKRIATDTGLNVGQVKGAMAQLIESTIVEYSESTSEVLIRHWERYNWNKSPKLDKPLASSIDAVKEPRFKQYLVEHFNNTRSIQYPYSIDTVSILPISISIPTTSSKGVGVQGEGKPEKHAYGETGNVFLTDAELEKLKNRFPDDWQERIDNLGYYIGSTGKAYKSHYLTILNWERKNSGSSNTRREVKADERWSKYR